MKYNVSDKFIEFIKSGDFVLLGCKLDSDLKNFCFDYYATDRFNKFIMENNNYEDDEEDDLDFDTILSNIIMNHFITDYYTVLSLKYNDFKNIDDKLSEIMNAFRSDDFKFDTVLVRFFPKYHVDYQKVLIDTTLEFFKSLPNDEFEFINSIYDISLYHIKDLKNTAYYINTYILDELKYYDIHIVDIIMRKESSETVFIIAIPNGNNLIGYWLREIENFSDTFKSIYYQYRTAVMISKFGFSGLEKRGINIGNPDTIRQMFPISVKIVTTDPEKDYTESDKLAAKYFAAIGDVVLK